MNGEAIRLRDRILEECRLPHPGHPNLNNRVTPNHMNSYLATTIAAYQVPVTGDANGYQATSVTHEDVEYQSLDALNDSQDNQYKSNTSQSSGYTPVKPPDIVPQHSDHNTDNNLEKFSENLHQPPNSLQMYQQNTNNNETPHTNGVNSNDGDSLHLGTDTEHSSSNDKGKSTHSKISRLYVGRTSRNSEETSF